MSLYLDAKLNNHIPPPVGEIKKANKDAKTFIKKNLVDKSALSPLARKRVEFYLDTTTGDHQHYTDEGSAGVASNDHRDELRRHAGQQLRAVR